MTRVLKRTLQGLAAILTPDQLRQVKELLVANQKAIGARGQKDTRAALYALDEGMSFLHQREAFDMSVSATKVSKKTSKRTKTLHQEV